MSSEFDVHDIRPEYDPDWYWKEAPEPATFFRALHEMEEEGEVWSIERYDIVLPMAEIRGWFIPDCSEIPFIDPATGLMYDEETDTIREVDTGRVLVKVATTAQNEGPEDFEDADLFDEVSKSLESIGIKLFRTGEDEA